MNPKADAIDSVKADPGVTPIPEAVGPAIVALPMLPVTQVHEGGVKTGIVNVQIATAGLSETDEAKGSRKWRKRLEMLL